MRQSVAASLIQINQLIAGLPKYKKIVDTYNEKNWENLNASTSQIWLQTFNINLEWCFESFKEVSWICV